MICFQPFKIILGCCALLRACTRAGCCVVVLLLFSFLFVFLFCFSVSFGIKDLYHQLELKC